jgi:hypothetical protein
MSPKKLMSILFCFLAMISCVDNLDFSQIEDYNITPEYTVSLTYFTVSSAQFFNQAGVQESIKSDITGFRIFDNSFTKENLVKLDFNVEIKNEFDREFTLQIDFFDDNNNLTHRFNEIKVNASNLNYKFQETVEVRANPNIKNTTIVRVVIIDNSAEPLDASATTEFEFKSSAKIYIDTDA